MIRITGSSTRVVLVFAWLVLWLSPDVRALDYSSPTLGSVLTDPRDLQVENIRILQELALPDGNTLLEVAADVRNLESALWSAVVVGASDALAGGWPRCCRRR